MDKRMEIPAVHADPQQGLTAEQVQQRIAAGWVSGEPVSRSRSDKEIILAHTLTFFNFVFVLLAVFLIISRSSVLNMGFLAAAAINSCIAVLQELRAKRAVESLTLVARKPVQCVRDGVQTEINAGTLVRDDIAVFSQGDQLCADGILRQGNLFVDESQITGEADSVEKQPGDPVHSGSIVLSGLGFVECTAVGEDSQAAQLARKAKENPAAGKGEMMRSLDNLILYLGIALVPIGGMLFYQEFSVLHLGLRTSTEATVAALVGMIPEGLYVLTSIALALASRKLGKQKVLVQNRTCIETLARVDMLCVDKTGTITATDMEVEDIVPLTDVPAQELQEILTAMYCTAPAENATAAAIAELFAGESVWVCQERIPFTSETKWTMASFAEKGSFLVGAPENILGGQFAAYADVVGGWADQGYRVLMVARYDGPLLEGGLDCEQVTPLALLLLSNRLRPQVQETFAYFAEQGVTVKVISGDNPATVSKIAGDAGIAQAEKYLDLSEFADDADFSEAVRDYTVFGRVRPLQKKALVEAMQRAGHTVAMTGDGVNDLLAMKQADCSIAMGSGTQAASQIASLVLLENDFSAMPSVVAEGRRVINNIQRAAALFLVKNIFSLFLSIITLYTNWPYPLQPIQISVLSWLTISIPSFLLTFEPNYTRISGKFLPQVLRRAFPGGITNVVVVLVCQMFMILFGLESFEASTVCTALLCFVGLLVLYQVCKPFNRFRAVMWGSLVIASVACFAVLGEWVYLTISSVRSYFVMAVLLTMTPTVFIGIGKLFDWGDRLAGWFRHHIAPLQVKKNANL